MTSETVIPMPIPEITFKDVLSALWEAVITKDSKHPENSAPEKLNDLQVACHKFNEGALAKRVGIKFWKNSNETESYVTNLIKDDFRSWGQFLLDLYSNEMMSELSRGHYLSPYRRYLIAFSDCEHTTLDCWLKPPLMARFKHPTNLSLAKRQGDFRPGDKLILLGEALNALPLNVNFHDLPARPLFLPYYWQGIHTQGLCAVSDDDGFAIDGYWQIKTEYIL